MSINNLKLAQEVRKRKCLYVKDTSTVMVKSKRDAAWLEISKVFNQPVANCQSKWRALRDRYVRLCRKADKGEIDKNECLKWNLWPYMTFLNGHFEKRSHQLEKDSDIIAIDASIQPVEAISFYEESTLSTQLDENNSLEPMSPKELCSDRNQPVKLLKFSKMLEQTNSQNTVQFEHVDSEISLLENTTAGINYDTEDNYTIEQQQLTELSSRLILHLEKVDAFLENRQRAKKRPCDDEDSSFYDLVHKKLLQLSEDEKEQSKIYILNYLFDKVSESRKRRNCETCS